jgi:hypothetical protein
VLLLVIDQNEEAAVVVVERIGAHVPPGFRRAPQTVSEPIANLPQAAGVGQTFS